MSFWLIANMVLRKIQMAKVKKKENSDCLLIHC